MPTPEDIWKPHRVVTAFTTDPVLRLGFAEAQG
jgi:hypothetical protein